jgi:hypothetical protein
VATIFLVLAFLCQHRTVWAAEVSALLALTLANQQARQRLAPALVLVPFLSFVAYGLGFWAVCQPNSGTR